MASTAPSNILSAVLLVVGVAVMLVVHILVVFWALRRGLGSRGATADEERAESDSCAGGGVGLTDGELDTLPCYQYRAAAAAAEDGGGGGAGDCAVCLEQFEDGDRCRRLPWCEHGFHAPCVDSWLRKSRLCPVCRADAVERTPRKAEVTGETAAAGQQQQVEMAERRSPTASETDAGR